MVRSTMARPLRLASALAVLAVQAIALAALLLPAFAIANGTIDSAQWPAASRHGFPIMAALLFAALVLLELLSRPLGIVR